MSDALAKFTEEVAAAKRELAVSEALVHEHQSKLRLAEDEVSASYRRLEVARHALEQAVLAEHEAVHGKPVSFDDRYEFEKRWDASVEANNARHEAIRKASEIRKAQPV